MSGAGRRPRMRILALTLVVALTAACGNGGDPQPATGAGGVEKADLTIGMLPLPEVAPIQIAIDKGYFAAEGLKVKYELIQGGAAAIPDLVSGKLDLLHSNYVSALLAASTGAAKLKVVGEAYVAKNGNFVLMTKKDSPIKTLADLKGKKVGVNTSGNVATLAVSALVKTAGLTTSDITFVERPFPQMAGALDGGIVDAAVMPEPFWQTAAGQSGAATLSELFTANTLDFPMAGYLTTDEFARANPKTVAAFQRGLRKAVDLAISTPAEAKAAMLKYTKIDQATADQMKLGGYSPTIDKARLQRVADLMVEFGYLKSAFDVAPLLLPAGTS
ncbi:ABC transporter substrate-binding protein [Nonomuraea sp. NN258]|uniref:ABC transporter substrate-binding protein n=1 Tax=Nonomuraea antri TaxID=2730852 RepID=UPI001569FD3C|nr:ABC transporter substrate-binding protein [Nonomuraea antri]NRQ38288.1 ABC transporter substrate-binding protein [Nonomuraea antri]